MVEPRYMFIKFKDETIAQVSEISHISPAASPSSHPLYKMLLKNGTVMFLTKKEYDDLVKAFEDSSYSIGLVDLADED